MPVHKDETIQKNPWYYAFEVKDGETGKRRTIKKRGFRTRREAEVEEVEARNSWNKGTYIKPDQTPFGEYIQQWLSIKQNISDQTREVNLGHIKHHIIPLIGHIPLAKLNVTNIEYFISRLQEEERNLADSTIRKIYNIVNTSLNAAAKKEIIQKNPTTLLESAPKVSKKKINVWTIEEVRAFLGGFESRYKIVYQLAIFTGMRMGEITGLSIDDIDIKNKKIRIRQILDFNGKIKTGAKTLSGNRAITIPDSLIGAIDNQIKKMIEEIENNDDSYNPERLLICTKSGKPYRKQQLTKEWYQFLEKTKVKKIRFHDLRHTCASLLLQLGTHPKVVQELLGHSSIKITLDLYSHLMPNMQSDAINVLGNVLEKEFDKNKQ